MAVIRSEPSRGGIHDKGARVVIIDPLDVWWGIRLIADGQSPSRYSMPIFGGVCFFHFVGWSCISFGFHIDVASPNLEVHFPFGFVRIGWQGTQQWRERRAVGRLYLQ